ncbi:MAG: hypothetical protein J7M29_12835 [Verrucomicrobia bacterium]|nr:hypothetical protein [Verrucomicrobiota bacterium]
MSGAEFQSLDEGRILVAARWLPLLQANGLTAMSAVMALSGEMMRSVPGRSTVRVTLPRPEGSLWTGYLKRYTPEYLSAGRRWLRRMGWPAAQDEAGIEWRAIHDLRARGFATAEPVALGQEREGGIVTRSFLLTAEIAGGVAGHEYAPGLAAPDRKRLLQEVAELTRRFHRAGFVHQDYYLNHIFAVPGSEGGERLFLIDLQRVFRPRWFRERWIVKDLAQLAYTARLAGASRSELLRFYLAYAGRGSLAAADKRRWRWIARRVRRLERRRPKYEAIWDRPGVRPRNV